MTDFNEMTDKNYRIHAKRIIWNSDDLDVLEVANCRDLLNDFNDVMRPLFKQRAGQIKAGLKHEGHKLDRNEMIGKNQEGLR